MPSLWSHRRPKISSFVVPETSRKASVQTRLKSCNGNQKIWTVSFTPSKQITGKITSIWSLQSAIRSVLGSDAAIWSLTIAEPGNDVVRRPEDLAAFRTAMRKTYRDIKDRHGEGKTINLFPVLPVSLAVEAGRVWMPKADLALRLYDHVRDRGFVETFSIGET